MSVILRLYTAFVALGLQPSSQWCHGGATVMLQWCYSGVLWQYPAFVALGEQSSGRRELAGCPVENCNSCV
jgi:hypothetical protein